ncbi:MAG: hypothetical protein ACO1O2_24630 [Larkinella arboricola]
MKRVNRSRATKVKDNMNTLKTGLIGLELLILLFSGCQQKPPFPQDESCFKGTTLKKVRDREGVIAFNSIENKYSINTHVAGTYDSQGIGFLCNLPDSLKQNGRLVHFDGHYYKYDEGRTPNVGGTTYYYLKITNLKK